MWQCWVGVGQGLCPRECGILIWAICNDRPPMGAEEWQVERLWQVLIAVRKSSWRMCQLRPLPFLSSPLAVVLCCVSDILCTSFDSYLLKVSEESLSPSIFLSLPCFLYFGWRPGATTFQCNSSILPPLPFCSPFKDPTFSFPLLWTVVDIPWTQRLGLSWFVPWSLAACLV